MFARKMRIKFSNSFIDSCAFDPKYGVEQAAANEIFRLDAEHDLSLLIAHSVRKELEHPNTPEWVKRKGLSKIHSIQVQLTRDELALKRNIHTILTGNGKPEKMKEDAEHIFEAQKYGSCFITTDGRLLKHAADIHALCSVVILRPSEFLEYVRAAIEDASGDLDED
jgi:hypothetical protein